jgi:hypothetical protein
MYTFLNYSSRCLCKNYIQTGRLLRNGRGFRDRVLHFQLSPTLSRKDNSMLTPYYWFPNLFSLSVILKYKLPVPASIFFGLKTARFLSMYAWLSVYAYRIYLIQGPSKGSDDLTSTGPHLFLFRHWPYSLICVCIQIINCSVVRWCSNLLTFYIWSITSATPLLCLYQDHRLFIPSNMFYPNHLILATSSWF